MFLPTKLAVFTQIRRVSTEVPPNSPPYHRKDCTTYPDGSAATLSRMGHRRSFAQHQRRISHAIGPGQTQEYEGGATKRKDCAAIKPGNASTSVTRFAIAASKTASLKPSTGSTKSSMI